MNTKSLITRTDEMTGTDFNWNSFLRGQQVAETWKRPEVKESRSARYGVVVQGQQFPSVAKAFEAFGVSRTKIIPLRAKLRDNGFVMVDELTFFKSAA